MTTPSVQCASLANWCLGHGAFLVAELSVELSVHASVELRAQCTHQPSGPETLSLLEENTAMLGENIFFTGFGKKHLFTKSVDLANL